MGGFVSMRMAIRYPQLLRSLILMETSAKAEDEEKSGRYKLLGFVSRWFGIRAVLGQVMRILFGQKFLNDPAREAEKKSSGNF